MAGGACFYDNFDAMEKEEAEEKKENFCEVALPKKKKRIVDYRYCDCINA